MRLLTYVARTFAGAIALCLLGLVVLVVAVTLIESAGRLTAAESSGTTALKLAVYGAMEYGYQVLPVACFLGSLIAGTLLARRGELLAVFACGVGVGRLWLAFVGVALATSLVGVGCGEWVVPKAVAGIEQVQREELGRVNALTRFYNHRTKWFKKDDVLLYLPVLDVQAQVFRKPTIYRTDGTLVEQVLEGEQLHYETHEAQWYVQDARVYSIATAQVQRMARLPLALDVTPQDLIDITGNPRQMRTAHVMQLIERRKNAGFEVTAHRVELHSRYGFPLLGIGMVLLALPWCLNPDRRRSLAVTLGAGVVVVALVLVLTQIFRLMALGHKIPPWLGAWAPLLVCVLMFPVSLAAYNRYRVRGSLW